MNFVYLLTLLTLGGELPVVSQQPYSIRDFYILNVSKGNDYVWEFEQRVWGTETVRSCVEILKLNSGEYVASVWCPNRLTETFTGWKRYTVETWNYDIDREYLTITFKILQNE